jgi:type IV secretory pathway TrbL component
VFLVQIIIVLLVVGVILWALSQFPIDATLARLIRVVVIVAVAIWLIYILAGAFGGGPIFRHG